MFWWYRLCACILLLLFLFPTLFYGLNVEAIPDSVTLMFVFYQLCFRFLVRRQRSCHRKYLLVQEYHAAGAFFISASVSSLFRFILFYLWATFFTMTFRIKDTAVRAHFDRKFNNKLLVIFQDLKLNVAFCPMSTIRK